MTDATTDNVALLQVIKDIARMQGTLDTLLNEHGRRIVENETVSRQLRVDLTSINDTLSEKVTVATENIKDLRSDVTEMQLKSNGASAKIILVVNTLIALAAVFVAYGMRVSM